MKQGDAKALLREYQSKGIGARVGFGEHPAVLVIDFIVGFTDPSSPLSAPLDKELESTLQLLAMARSRKVPIVFSTVSYSDHSREAGLFSKKVPSLKTLKSGSRWVELDQRLKRASDEVLLTKKFASCFFGTHLASYLTSMRVDTLLVAGCTTSGCVRATVVDALQNGFRTIVPIECVGDRASEPHIANLLDMDAKYADVVTLSESLEYLEKLESREGEVFPND